jgi:hypothetical protein
MKTANTRCPKWIKMQERTAFPICMLLRCDHQRGHSGNCSHREFMDWTYRFIDGRWIRLAGVCDVKWDGPEVWIKEATDIAEPDLKSGMYVTDDEKSWLPEFICAHFVQHAGGYLWEEHHGQK